MSSPTVLVLSSPGKFLGALEKLRDSTTIVVSNQPDVLQREAPRADVILLPFADPGQLQLIFPLATRLRWVHVLAAGVERIVFPELVASPVILTNARGVFKKPLAEFVMAAVLFFAKGLRRLVRSQEAGNWDPFDVEEVRGKVMGIVGYGETGRASAELAHAFGMRVLGLRRRPQLASQDPWLESVFGLDHLHEMLARCDFITLAAPDTPQTRGLIGQAEIASMQAGAVLINVGRGSLVDEAALVEALREKRLRGAALDVFNQEPLPAGHAFYQLENVLLSPHSADHTPGWQELALQGFIRNLERFRKGEPLENIVDKTAGY